MNTHEFYEWVSYQYLILSDSLMSSIFEWSMELLIEVFDLIFFNFQTKNLSLLTAIPHQLMLIEPGGKKSYKLQIKASFLHNMLIVE